MAIKIKTVSAEGNNGTLDFLESVLYQTGKRAMEGASRRMKLEAEAIQLRASEQAPVDDRGIENSIRIDRELDGNRRVTYSIYVDGNTISGDGTPVRDYVLWIHEGSYKLGKLSWQKAMSSNRIVGPKFLSRAADVARDRVNQSIFNEIKKVMK